MVLFRFEDLIMHQLNLADALSVVDNQEAWKLYEHARSLSSCIEQDERRAKKIVEVNKHLRMYSETLANFNL